MRLSLRIAERVVVEAAILVTVAAISAAVLQVGVIGAIFSPSRRQLATSAALRLLEAAGRAFELLVALHDLVQLLLRALQLSEPLDEVRIDRALQLVRVLDQLDEPVAIRRKVVQRLQLAHGDAICVAQSFSYFRSVFDDLVAVTIVDKLRLLVCTLLIE